MSRHDPALLEQLSAWMDGELPADQARFLQRRLVADPALRATWERWQRGADALSRRPVRAMPPGLPERVASRVEAPARARRWAAGLAAALLVALVLPNAMDDGEPVTPTLAGSRPALPMLASPAPGPVSPLPVGAAPVAPLDSLVAKPWPRSPLAPGQGGLAASLVEARTRPVPADAPVGDGEEGRR